MHSLSSIYSLIHKKLIIPYKTIYQVDKSTTNKHKIIHIILHRSWVPQQNKRQKRCRERFQRMKSWDLPSQGAVDDRGAVATTATAAAIGAKRVGVGNKKGANFMSE